MQLVSYKPVGVAERIEAWCLVVPNLAAPVGQPFDAGKADYEVGVQHIMVLGGRLEVFGEVDDKGKPVRRPGKG